MESHIFHRDIGTDDYQGQWHRSDQPKVAERPHIQKALRRAGGNQGTAAALLGISRPALNRRLARMQED